jgi:hypothetical protein
VTVRFLADEDLDSDIIDGLRLREPAIDVLDVKEAGLRATKDLALLELAAPQDRIVISHDWRTMTRYFGERLAAGESNPVCSLCPNAERSPRLSNRFYWCGPHRRRRSGAMRIVYLPVSLTFVVAERLLGEPDLAEGLSLVCGNQPVGRVDSSPVMMPGGLRRRCGRGSRARSGRWRGAFRNGGGYE